MTKKEKLYMVNQDWYKTNSVVKDRKGAVDFSGTRFMQTGVVRDGTKIVKPHIVLGPESNGISPRAMDKSTCRRMIVRFMNLGAVIHGRGSWCVIEYCRAKNIEYDLIDGEVRKSNA